MMRASGCGMREGIARFGDLRQRQGRRPTQKSGEVEARIPCGLVAEMSDGYNCVVELSAGGGTVTPVELSIEADLNLETQRFNNDWLFKWYGMTYEGGNTDVEDFRGGRIHFSGITFGYQQQTIYWQAIDVYLRQKTHAIFKQWDSDSKSYPLTTRRASIDGVEQTLKRFVARILSLSLNTEKRLRGNGNPYIPSSDQTYSGGEISYLAAAHRALIDQAIEEQKAQTPRSYWKWLEAFYANNKGLTWLCTAILVPVIGFAWHYFFN
jgi:hypothetical protein